MNPSGFYVDPWLGYTLKRKLANRGNPLTPPFKKIDHIGAVRKKHPATKVESKGFLHYGKQVIFPDRY